MQDTVWEVFLCCVKSIWILPFAILNLVSLLWISLAALRAVFSSVLLNTWMLVIVYSSPEKQR